MRAEGAIVLKNVDCIVFEDFLKEKLSNFLKHEAKYPGHVFF